MAEPNEPRGVRVLCCADFHVGRRPARVPADADARDWSAAAMVGGAVDLAVAERCDLFAVAGDWIDLDSRYHEALGPIERGLRRLADAGIEAVAVAGNHDHDVLPRVAADLAARHPGGLRLLGAGGRWESATVCGGRLRVVGWSFPAAEHRGDPLDALDPTLLPADGVPTVGLLHTQLDDPAGRYAPTTSARLAGTRVALWLLGHVHAPQWPPGRPGGPAILYPGSPQALDPGEPGEHGPWVVEIAPDGRCAATHHPISRVRYLTATADLGGVESRGEFDRRTADALRAALPANPGALRFCSVRLALTGRTPLHGRFRAWADDLERQYDPGDGSAGVDRVIDRTEPAVDLADLARHDDVAGELARTLIDLQDGGRGDLVARAADRVAAVTLADAYRPVHDPEHDPDPTPADVRDLLVRQGMDLLAELRRQRSGARSERNDPSTTEQTLIGQGFPS